MSATETYTRHVTAPRVRHLITRLLRRNVSGAQIAGYAVASFVGLAIVLTAIQFYRDVRSAWSAPDKLMGENYLILSKKVSGLGGLFGAPATLSDDEMADLARQPWVQNVGAFTAADFDVTASAQLGRGHMSTSLFLEAVPDEFFDVRPPEWNYRPGHDAIVPVIIPKDYLALYNFGYASSHGLPQLSESMMGMLPLRLSLSGNGKQETVQARIVGFSSRLNTIAVPLAFLSDANTRLSSTAQAPPSRVIVKVTDKGDPAIKAYLEKHSLEAAGDNSDAGHLSYILSIVMAVVITVGAVITVLAFFILLLSLYLLLQKNRSKIHDMMLLGIRPGAIAAVYTRLVITVNIGVLLLSTAAVLTGRALWGPSLGAIGIRATSPWLTIGIGVGIMLILTIADVIAIKRRIRSTFRLT
ncbi:MAG: ABC transporter permease [Candidatus Amulumruptor caecigallinarius]|nr:ABC transporter permease [Candidatus Amulumruptor caecigallinarius]MCM1397608.1 ABC transporter permease [Candidatus Amulumruptor caecigallinarius]MCM1454609.1 ABC transporter permease [bacterium]